MRTSRTIQMGAVALCATSALVFGLVTAAHAVDQPDTVTVDSSITTGAISAEIVSDDSTTEDVQSEETVTDDTQSQETTEASASVIASASRVTSQSNNGGANNTNEVAYWNNLYSEYNAVCYKHEPSYNGDHGYVADNKRVVLAPYGATWPGDGYIALIVDGGSNEQVYEFPIAGDHDYVAPLNNGGNIPDVSHWIVCKGDLPVVVDEKPTVTYDCVAIDADQHRALKEGDHINITINGSQPVNAYVDLNVAGGYNGLGLRINGHDPVPLTQAEVESGVIHYEYSKYLDTKTFTLEFIQSGATDLWPDLECAPEPPKFESCPAATTTVNVYQDSAAAQGIGVTFTRDNGTLAWDGASWIFSTPGSNDKITFGLSSTEFVIPLAELTALSFEGVLLEEGSDPRQIVSFNIPADVNGSAPGGFTTIVVEAVYNNGSFDAFMGGDAIVWSSNAVNGFPNRDTFQSWKFFLQENPDTVLGGQVLLNQGGGNAGLVTRVTSFTAGNSVECIKYVPSVRPPVDTPVDGTPVITVDGPDCDCLYNTINYDIPVGLSVNGFTGTGSIRAEDFPDARGDGTSIYGHWVVPVVVLPGYTYSGQMTLEFDLIDPASLDCDDAPPPTKVDNPGGANTGDFDPKPSGFVWPFNIVESIMIGLGAVLVAASAAWLFVIRPRKRAGRSVAVEAP